MTFETYLELFDPIIRGENKEAPYNDPAYINYTKLNRSRQNRWLKTGKLSDELKTTIVAITKKQKWIIITEPWCGDAAHNLPFLILMSALNDKIEIEIQLRDAEPFLIEKYLTNQGKSIPKVIARNETGEDLFTWGPRPEPCQKLMLNNIALGVEFEIAKIAIQDWYNNDAGETLQNEFLDIFTQLQKTL